MANTFDPHSHSHISQAVAAMDSCFILVRIHQHGIAPGREPNKVQRIICPLLLRGVHIGKWFILSHRFIQRYKFVDHLTLLLNVPRENDKLKCYYGCYDQWIERFSQTAILLLVVSEWSLPAAGLLIITWQNNDQSRSKLGQLGNVSRVRLRKCDSLIGKNQHPHLNGWISDLQHLLLYENY